MIILSDSRILPPFHKTDDRDFSTKRPLSGVDTIQMCANFMQFRLLAQIDLIFCDKEKVVSFQFYDMILYINQPEKSKMKLLLQV